MADENTNNEVSNQELEFTGNTVTLTETVNYTESERKDNAMILAEKMTQLENLKEEYNQLIIDNNNAIREMRADIEELEQEISDIRDGVVTGTAEVTNEYDEYETETHFARNESENEIHVYLAETNSLYQDRIIGKAVINLAEKD